MVVGGEEGPRRAEAELRISRLQCNRCTMGVWKLQGKAGNCALTARLLNLSMPHRNIRKICVGEMGYVHNKFDSLWASYLMAVRNWLLFHVSVCQRAMENRKKVEGDWANIPTVNLSFYSTASLATSLMFE